MFEGGKTEAEVRDQVIYRETKVSISTAQASGLWLKDEDGGITESTAAR